MEMVRQYIGYDPLYNPACTMNWSYLTSSSTSFTFKEVPIQKPQELVQKYINIRKRHENTFALAA